MTKPLVSIITPTYNRASLLGETLESVLRQSFTDFEYLVVDDGSTDETLELLAEYADRRLRLIRNASNQGEVASINRAWAEAQGEYVAILSSDDPVLPMWLGEMVKALQQEPAAIVAYPDWNMIDMHGDLLRIQRTPDYHQAKMVSNFIMGVGPGALIRKSAGDRLPAPRRQQYRHCADLDMWLHLSLFGPFVRVPKVLAAWRSHPDSITVAVRTRQRAEELLALAREFFGRPDLPEPVVAVAENGLRSACNDAAGILEAVDPEGAQYFRTLSTSFVGGQGKGAQALP